MGATHPSWLLADGKGGTETGPWGRMLPGTYSKLARVIVFRALLQNAAQAVTRSCTSFRNVTLSYVNLRGTTLEQANNDLTRF